MKWFIPKLAYGVFFLFMALFSSAGPTGHTEPRGSVYYAPVLILIGGAIVVIGKWPRLNSHIAWASIYAASLLFTYRCYCYEETNSRMYERSLRQLEKKADPAATAQRP